MIRDLAKIVLDIDPDHAPYNPYRNLTKLAIQDAAACHALLSTASTVWATVHHTSATLESTFHRIKAVQAISQRLEGGARPSELTILAVILLWSHEVLTKNYES